MGYQWKNQKASRHQTKFTFEDLVFPGFHTFYSIFWIFVKFSYIAVSNENTQWYKKSAGTINITRHWAHQINFKTFFCTKSHSVEKESRNSKTYILTLQDFIAFFIANPNFIPRFVTLPNTPRCCQKSTSWPQWSKKDHKKHWNFIMQTKSSIQSAKNNRELSTSAEDPSWLWVLVGLPKPILTHRVFDSPPNKIFSPLLLLNIQNYEHQQHFRKLRLSRFRRRDQS